MFNDIPTHDLILYIYLIILLLLIIPFSISLKYYEAKKRKFNYVYLKEILTNHSDKITDSKDLLFLKEMLPKLEKYYQRWYLNLGPYYAFKQHKIVSIARKYNIVVFDIYK